MSESVIRKFGHHLFEIEYDDQNLKIKTRTPQQFKYAAGFDESEIHLDLACADDVKFLDSFIDELKRILVLLENE